jgi:hypothetical protein
MSKVSDLERRLIVIRAKYEGRILENRGVLDSFRNGLIEFRTAENLMNTGVFELCPRPS